MDIQYFITQLESILKPLDIASILIVMVATHNIKRMLPARWRPLLAFALGLIVASAWAIANGGWESVPAYGLLYGAGAAFTRDLWRRTIRGQA